MRWGRRPSGSRLWLRGRAGVPAVLSALGLARSGAVRPSSARAAMVVSSAPAVLAVEQVGFGCFGDPVDDALCLRDAGEAGVCPCRHLGSVLRLDPEPWLMITPPPLKWGWHSRMNRMAASAPEVHAAMHASSLTSSKRPWGTCWALFRNSNRASPRSSRLRCSKTSSAAQDRIWTRAKPPTVLPERGGSSPCAPGAHGSLPLRPAPRRLGRATPGSSSEHYCTSNPTPPSP